jgi:diguanylate cyclase (GGDEF)-like protein
MQPGHTGAAKTISTFGVALLVLGMLAGLTLIGLIWLMAMRTWILQRAVVRRTAALRRTLTRVRQLAVTDELTGLFNRRYFLERWLWEYERARRYKRELSCLMIDVDGFKQVNDFLGHDSGDLALKHVAEELRRLLRQADILARFGGDEFIIALPETGHEQASAVAEKLRSVTIQGPWTDHPGVGAVRMSVGVGHLTDDVSSQQIIQMADKELYASRRARRAKRTTASPYPL